MTQPLSVAVQALVDQAHRHATDAVVADAAGRYLPWLRLPVEDLGDLPFSAPLAARWDSGVADRVTEAVALRDRLGGTASGLLRAAADYSGTDESTAVEIDAAGRFGPDDGITPLLEARHANRGWLTAGREVDFAAIRSEAPLPANLDPTDIPDTTGRDAMLAFTSDHLTTLTRAEELLELRGRLDFTSPTAYLRQVAGVRPGAARQRAELLGIIAAHAREDGTDPLTDSWSGGEAADAFAAHVAATDGFRTEIGTAIDRQRAEAESVADLLDGLLTDIVNDASSMVDSVHASRIGRIREAVDLVEEARDFGAGSVSPLWTPLSGADEDATVQVLYKRVWYLANAFASSISRAENTAQSILDAPAPTAAEPPARAGADWRPAPASSTDPSTDEGTDRA